MPVCLSVCLSDRLARPVCVPVALCLSHCVQLHFVVIHVGAPAAGVNTATLAFLRLSMFFGHVVYAVHEGFEGLAKGLVCEIAGAYGKQVVVCRG